MNNPGIMPSRQRPGIFSSLRIVPYREPPPPFSPLNFPDCLSWWDCLGGDQITLGGTGGVQVVGLADLGPANVPLSAFSAPTTGIPVGSWEIAGDVVPLPGPLTGGAPRAVLEGSTAFAIGDLSIVALIPLGSVTSDAYYWSYSHGTIPVVRVALTASVSPTGRIRLTLGSGIGTSVQTVPLLLDGTAGPAAHALVVATLDVGTGAVSLDVWYDLDTGSGIQHPAAVKSAGYVGTSAEYATLGGRRNTTDQWAGADARLHTVVTYARVLDAGEVEQIREWAYARLGWEDP